MNTSSHRIVGTGLFALDVIVRSDGKVSPPSLGGSAGNVLCILGALGWKATPIGTLGEDPAAQIVQRDFMSVEADLRFMECSVERCTPIIYQHQLPAQGGSTHRFSFACPTCGVRRRPHWDGEGRFAVERSALPSSSVFFLDRPTRLGVALAEHYAQSGTVVVFEPSEIGVDPDLFARAVRSAHIVKYADDRISGLAGFDLESVLVEIQTRGVDGLRFRAPSLDNRWLSLGAYELPHVHDTAGAGDWCTAGMLFELFSRGAMDQRVTDYNVLARALTFGQALSALNCMTEGARGLLATWSPSRIVRSARELSALRLNALFAERLQPSARFSEPRLAALANGASQSTKKPRSGSEGYLCCPAP